MSQIHNNQLFRYIPAVDEILKASSIELLLKSMPRPLVLDAIRDTIAELRKDIKSGYLSAPLDNNPREFLTFEIINRTTHLAKIKNRSNLRRVLNLTGVVLHTNLGRAVLSDSAQHAIINAASGYTNLELDLHTGKRGSRYAPVEELLTRLTGAEAALVVNNNAAAVLLALSTLAKGGEVIVSRGQLVEIGGSFRIPDIMTQSGARLVEVGCTNRTHPADYKNALTPETVLLLNVHTSNYRIVGFTRETSIAQLVSLGEEVGLPVMCDLGSGSLVDFNDLGLPEEPTVQEVVRAGADVVTFSGDKLLGATQAGIIVGKKEYIDRMKKNPLTRAVRIDKFTVAGLEATLREYIEDRKCWQQVPTLNMIAKKQDLLGKIAQELCEKFRVTVGHRAIFNTVKVSSAIGGGSLPVANLPSWAIEILPHSMSVFELAANLREAEPAVIGRLQDDKLLLDVRTLLHGEEDDLVKVVSRVLNKGGARD